MPLRRAPSIDRYDEIPRGGRGPPPPPPRDPATRIRDGDRARCTFYMLRDDASLWWEGAAHAVDMATLTWARFKEMFFGKYFPADVRSRLTREFMSLRRGDLSVADFICKFDRRCHFVPMIARDAAEKLRHFLDGLRPTLRRDVMLMRPAEGHKAADYPRNKGPITGRDYVRHAEEAEADPDSTLITGVATHALLDSGAMHSFIYESLFNRLGIIPVAMDSGFRLLIIGDQMFTSQIVNRLELRLQKYTVHADLIELPLPEFDIILRMDWLSSHGVVIDFRLRSVSVRPLSWKPFVFEAARHQQMPHVISYLCAMKLMRRGCQAFLASIVSVTEPVSQRLEDVDVVSEFSSVFPDDISSVPPDREVEFSIELMSGTVPISKAQY
ncbi:uncharacterized protein LOC142556871 [Primulina tabacum]|uniref:uncharacterized protein LOC142556871 n=1 Tax=Primulina tabacum TaxID=48773 RepID=UPI003F5A94C0